MRARVVVVVAAALPLALAACASATVVENRPGGLVLRWDEASVSRSKVVNQAAWLCGDNGWVARRAIPIADSVEGTTHTTRFVCRAITNGG